jgi:hypothetical protein
MDAGNKENFLKIYANLPINLRQEIILVLKNKGPITWDVAFFEVDNDTGLSQEILTKLKQLKII